MAVKCKKISKFQIHWKWRNFFFQQTLFWFYSFISYISEHETMEIFENKNRKIQTFHIRNPDTVKTKKQSINVLKKNEQSLKLNSKTLFVMNCQSSNMKKKLYNGKKNEIEIEIEIEKIEKNDKNGKLKKKKMLTKLLLTMLLLKILLTMLLLKMLLKMLKMLKLTMKFI